MKFLIELATSCGNAETTCSILEVRLAHCGNDTERLLCHGNHFKEDSIITFNKQLPSLMRQTFDYAKGPKPTPGDF